MSKLTDQCQLGESTPSCLQTSLQMEQQDEPAVRSRMAFAPDLGENAYSGALPLTRLKALIINVLHYRSLVAGAVDERGRSTSSSRPTCLPCSRLSNPLSPNLGSGYTIINIASLDPYAPAPDRLDSTSTSTKKTINIFSNGFTHQHVSYGIHVNVVARSFRWSVLQGAAIWTQKSFQSWGLASRRWSR